MSKVNNLTVNDFIKKGAKLKVYFHHCEDLQTAYNKLKPYVSLGSIEKDSSIEGSVWLKIETRDIEIIAFL